MFSLAVDDDEARGIDAWTGWGIVGGAATSWAIASVNPPAAGRLAGFLTRRGVQQAAWFRSAAEVPVRHALEHPETAGADRALAVAGAVADLPEGRPGLVVLCGTAVTVERVALDGTWQGGAIAAGLGLTARALHMLTAQLPLAVPRGAPQPWGTSTMPALEAGVFWGVVGGVRELLTRQADDLGPAPWVVWTGGDADGWRRPSPGTGPRSSPTWSSAAWPGSRSVPAGADRDAERSRDTPGPGLRAHPGRARGGRRRAGLGASGPGGRRRRLPARAGCRPGGDAAGPAEVRQGRGGVGG